MPKNRNLRWLKFSGVAIGALVLLGVALVLITRAASEEDFAHPTNLSRTAKLGYLSDAPEIARKGSTFAVVWAGGFDANKLAGHIVLANADENDGYWRPRINVFTATTNAHTGKEPALIFDNALGSKIVHVVWSDANIDVGIGVQPIPLAIKYARCDVSGVRPTCTAPVTIAQGEYSTPAIAQDGSGNLHVVWVDTANNNTIYHSRSTNGENWSLPTQAQDTSGIAVKGTTPRLVYSNGRLHMVWVNSDKVHINYLYDDSPTDDILIATGANSWQADQGTFDGGQVGHPDLVAKGDLLFVTFDIRDPAAVDSDDNAEFLLVYDRSTTNGLGWTGHYKGIPDPDENLNYPSFGKSDIYYSNNKGVAAGLRPALAITGTSSITRLNIVWHFNRYPSSETSALQVYHSWVNVDTSANITETWYTPPYTVTNPPTPTPDPGAGRVPPAPNNIERIAGTSENDSVAPALAITDPAEGGQGKLHVAYLEDTDNAQDVFYRGFIAGTIDPLYLQDEDMFQMTNDVQPTLVVTSTDPLPSQTLAYTITLANTGDLNAIGVRITDTFNLPDDVTVTGYGATMSDTLSFDPATKTLLWGADIPMGETVEITMSAVTKDQLELPVTIINNAVLGNQASNSILTKPAQTVFQQYTIYLPLVMK